jgi:hypothetical protein
MSEQEAAAPQDEWSDTGPTAYPILAVVFGGAAIALLAIFIPAPTTASVNQEMLVALGVGLPVAALIWGVAYFVTVRHASPGWKLGSLALLALIAVVAADRSVYAANESLRFDLIQLDELRVGNDGFYALPPELGKPGPVTARLARFLREAEEDRRKIDGAVAPLKIQNLASGWALQQDSSVLDACDRTEPAKKLFRDYAARRQQRAEDFVAAMEAVNAPEATRKELAAMARERSAIAGIKRGGEIDVALLDQLHERCTILARRHWKPWGSMFMFTDAAEMKAFNDNAERHVALLRDPMAEQSIMARALSSRRY